MGFYRQPKQNVEETSDLVSLEPLSLFTIDMNTTRWQVTSKWQYLRRTRRLYIMISVLESRRHANKIFSCFLLKQLCLVFQVFFTRSFRGIAHYFDALFWHPHASSQHYIPVSPLRAIQLLMLWEQRRLSVPRRARIRDLCRCRIPSARQKPLGYDDP